VFFRHLPVWIVVFFVTWLTHILAVSLSPLAQLLVCTPVGLGAGAAFICIFSPQRHVAMHLFDALRDLKKKQ
jgi:hypothetical protein